MPRDDQDETAHYPILTNKPIEIHDPKRKARLIAVTYGIAILICTFAGGYVATLLAADQSDDTNQQMQVELDQRKRQRDAEATRFQAALDQYRRDQCLITWRLPQDPEIQEIRHRYQCGPAQPAATTPPPSPPPSPGSPQALPRPPRAPAGPAPRAPAPPAPWQRPPAVGPAPRPPAPAPTPAPPPEPGPSPVCLPLLGICLI